MNKIYKMKKVVSLVLLGTTTSLMAMYAEQAYLYKDPRVMGMGGVNIAVGAYSTSVFSNPAGLANIKKEDGYVVDLFSLGLSGSAQITDFVQDISDANDAEDSEEEISKILEKYSGEHFHAGIDNYSSVSKNSDMFAWSIGILAALDTNFMAHGNGNDSAGLLETSSRAYGGVVLGAAKSYDTEIGLLDVGVGLKYISQVSYEGTLGISELADEDEDIADKLQEKYEEKSSGFGVDLGVTYKPLTNNYWKPAFGLSIMNIGAMDMDDNYGGQPTTVNIGASVTPKVDYLDKLVLAIDYVDVFGSNKLRMYDFDDTDIDDPNYVGGNVYTDYDTYSFIKNLRLGVGMTFVDSTYFSTTLNLGMYQGSYTAGLDMVITTVKFNFATYQEQVGDDTTPYYDRRYMAQLGIGW